MRRSCGEDSVTSASSGNRARSIGRVQLPLKALKLDIFYFQTHAPPKLKLACEIPSRPSLAGKASCDWIASMLNFSIDNRSRLARRGTAYAWCCLPTAYDFCFPGFIPFVKAMSCTGRLCSPTPRPQHRGLEWQQCVSRHRAWIQRRCCPKQPWCGPVRGGQSASHSLQADNSSTVGEWLHCDVI